MVNTFLLDVPSLRRRKQDSLYRADKGSLKVIKKLLQRKRIEFQRLDWNIPAHHPYPQGAGRTIVEYNMGDRDDEMRDRLKEDRFIVLNSSGYFHHRSYYFVESLEDVCYVQLDSHPDFWNGPLRLNGKLNGSGFVTEISRLDNVKDVYVVGVTPNEALAPEEESIKDIKKRVDDINLVLSVPLEAMIMEGVEGDPRIDYEKVYRKAMKLYPHLTYDQKPTEFNIDGLPDLPVYLSIDLDVIRMFPTNWQGHGRWDTEKLLETILEIGSKREVVGGDICGLDENSLYAKSNVMKHYWFVYQILRGVMTSK